MIRQLAQCPYCKRCEIALDDHPQLVFNPETSGAPCQHLTWVDGRYSQWEHPRHGVNREIGSIELRWGPPVPGTEVLTEELLPYLHELVESGPGWTYAPGEPFVLQTLNAEEKGTDAEGNSFVVWDVDGWAIFALNPAAFWAALPGCRERQLGALKFEEGEGTG